MVLNTFTKKCSHNIMPGTSHNLFTLKILAILVLFPLTIKQLMLKTKRENIVCLFVKPIMQFPLYQAVNLIAVVVVISLEIFPCP